MNYGLEKEPKLKCDDKSDLKILQWVFDKNLYVQALGNINMSWLEPLNVPAVGQHHSRDQRLLEARLGTEPIDVK